MKRIILFVAMACYIMSINATDAPYCLASSFGYGAKATGGGNATPILVSNADQFTKAVNKKSDKVVIITKSFEVSSKITLQDMSNITILGLQGVTLTNLDQTASKSGILFIKRSDNIIIRNLTLIGPGAYDVDGNDLLCFEGVTNAWVDHCDFQDGIDGNFDNKNTTDSVTVSWCRFRYLKAPIPGGSGGSDDHRFSNLLGSDKNDKPTDGTYNFTWAYCWWDEGCVERMVRCRNASLHFLNCYWKSSVADYYIGPENADAYVEGCWMAKLSKKDKVFYQNFNASTAKNGVRYINTYYEGGDLSEVSNRTVLVPSYDYTALTYSETKDAVTNTTCGAGATLDITEEGVITTPCVSTEPEPCITASGTCGAQGKNVIWQLSCDGVLTLSGTKAMENYNFNSSPWNEHKESITSVIIEDGVTNIGKSAFYECHNLTNIAIPNSVTNIDEWCFYQCTNLESVTLPDNVINIGDDAFRGCISLTDFTIPNSVQNIGIAAFGDCSGLTSIFIPNKVSSIGSGAFLNCENIESIVVDENNTHYDNRNNCNAIIETSSNTLITGCKNTIIPDNVIIIGNSAFYGCSNLSSIEIPNSVTSIGRWSFSNCTSLTEITIPNSVTKVDEHAFAYCSNLANIQFSNSLKTIGDFAFEFCENLTNLSFPANSNLKTIGNAAFQNCKKLETVIIPKSVTSIKQSPFFGCRSLTSIIVEEGNNVYDSRNNCNAIIETGTNTLIVGCQSTIISNDTKSIGEKAFPYITSLKTICIPNSVKSIGNEAFWSCTGLTSVTSQSVTPPQIASNAFSNVETSVIPLYVPAQSVERYKSDDVWKKFDIRAIGDELFTVTFVDYDGTPLATQKVEKGKAAAEPDAPTRNGYKFVGWDNDFSDIQADITIKAKYAKIIHGSKGDYIVKPSCE